MRKRIIERNLIMKRKHLMAMLLCAACLATTSAAVLAEETEAVTEASTDTEAEETEAKAERPDYQAADYVTLGEYKGLKVQIDLTASEDEIEEELNSAISRADVMEEITEGTVAEGDIVSIDYEGKLDGEAFDGGTAKDYDLEIGSGSFIDGFEDGLIGVNVGDTVDLNLTFPENYFSEDLAGQEVVFTVTVHAIKRMPELTDELVSTMTDGEYTTVDDYKASIRASLEEEKAGQRDAMIMSDLFTQVAANTTINEYPEVMVDYGVQEMNDYYVDMAESFSMEFADFLSMYLGMTEEEFNEQVVLAVQQNLQQEMYLKAIAETEGIELTEEEYEAGCEKYAETYGMESAEELVENYGESVVRLSLLQEKVLEFLKESAVIEEVTETELSTELSLIHI